MKTIRRPPSCDSKCCCIGCSIWAWEIIRFTCERSSLRSILSEKGMVSVMFGLKQNPYLYFIAHSRASL